MEKLQLKMRMLNIAMTTDSWKAFDLVIKFWQKIDVKEEAVMIGAIMSSGTHEVIEDIIKIANHDPDMLNRLKDIKIDKDDINEMYDVTI